MDLKQFLKDNPMINQAQLANAMWPDKKGSNIKLSHKLSNTQGQRITPKDEQLAIEALQQLGVNIASLTVG